jgi:large conductance mechanosensitive channel
VARRLFRQRGLEKRPPEVQCFAHNRPLGGEMLETTFKDFRDFLLRGNLILLAIAFVMGGAFAALVNSFVKNLIMPIVSMIFGKTSFSDLTFTINHSVFYYGAFISDAITFIGIAAAVFFFIVKPVELLEARRKTGEEAPVISDEERRHQELIAAIRAS